VKIAQHLFANPIPNGEHSLWNEDAASLLRKKLPLNYENIKLMEKNTISFFDSFIHNKYAYLVIERMTGVYPKTRTAV